MRVQLHRILTSLSECNILHSCIHNSFYDVLASLITYCSGSYHCTISPSFDGLQHRGIMYTKHVFKKIAKIQRSYVPLCGHTTFELLTSARTMTIINKITIFCNDVNKSSTSIKLLAINILHCMSYRSNVGLWN